MKVDGPFFVREGETYDLAPMCKECAFGDEEVCAMKPCIYFQFDEEVE